MVKRAPKKIPDHLTEQEIMRVVKAAGAHGRHRLRDGLMVYMGYRHGLRVSELCALEWKQVKWDRKTLGVERLKGGTPWTHDLLGPELRDLRKWQRETPDPTSPYIFMTERLSKISPRTFTDVILGAGKRAGVTIRCHPHILRHTCGFAMARRGVPTRTIQAWLGHTNIAMTVIYTQLAEGNTHGLW
jgi:integrase